MQWGVLVTVVMFIAGLIYKAGEQGNRLAVVERDQNRLYEELRGIRTALDELVGHMRQREH